MRNSNSTYQRVRRLWLICCLLPFPLANALVLPAGLLFAYYAILPAFLGVHFSPDSVRTFPSQEQINAYGLEFYKTLLSKSMLWIILSSGSWLGSIVIFFRTMKNLKTEQQDKIKKTSLLQCGLGLTMLSIMCGVLLILAIGMIG